jgi:murein hydrolase activator
MNYGRYIATLIFTLIVLSSQAQSIEALKAQKDKTAKEITYTNKLLNETGKSTKASLDKLSLISQQIELRHKMIDSYNSELSILEQSILDNIEVIQILEADLEKIKTDYAALLQQTYRNMGSVNQLLFVLSSESFNQAYKRLLYTRQLAQFRQEQAKVIQEIQSVMIKKVEDLSSRKTQQSRVLNQKMGEFTRLNQEKEEQSKYYSQLKSKERELRALLDKQRSIEQNLQNEIEKLIAEEARKNKSTPRTTEDRTLSDNFEKNKGRFPWPTQHGIVTDRFGEHSHPVMKNLIIKNNGVDITTNPGDKARSIFNGTVSKVFLVPGSNSAVIIRHGQYISVYANLKEVYVKQGDAVKTKQDIGLIYSDTEENNKTILKFQIWRDNVKLNPEDWISR